MRIIITPKGENEIEELSNTFHVKNLYKTYTKNRSKSTPKSNSLNDNKDSLSKTTKAFFKFGSRMSFYKRDELVVNNSELQQAKHIKLKKPKLSFTKHIYSNYSRESETVSFEKLQSFRRSLIIKDDPTKDLMSKMPVRSSSIKLNKKNIKIRELFSPTTYSKFSKDFILQEKEKKHFDLLTPDNYRTIYHHKKEGLLQMKEILNKEIKSDRTNIIKYFQQKDVISPLSVRNLSTYDDERLLRLNKVCQIVLHNQDKKKKFEELIEKKLIVKERNIKLVASKSVSNMRYDMGLSRKILNKYNVKKDNTNLLKQMVKSVKEKYWDKLKILEKRANRTKEIEGFSDIATTLKTKEKKTDLISKLSSTKNINLSQSNIEKNNNLNISFLVKNLNKKE